MQQRYNLLSGAGTAANGAATTALIAAQGAATNIRLISGVVSVTLAATGGGGVVSLKDGTTLIMRWDANAVGSFPFTFGEATGYPLSANSALNLVVESAVTNQATAYAALTAYLIK
jgi:hypothetical protein